MEAMATHPAWWWAAGWPVGSASCRSCCGACWWRRNQSPSWSRPPPPGSRPRAVRSAEARLGRGGKGEWGWDWPPWGLQFFPTISHSQQTDLILVIYTTSTHNPVNELKGLGRGSSAHLRVWSLIDIADYNLRKETAQVSAESLVPGQPGDKGFCFHRIS